MGVRKRLCCRTVYLCVAFRFCFGSNSTKIKTEKKTMSKKTNQPFKSNQRSFLLEFSHFFLVLVICIVGV